ncbi:hypothetical protein JCM16303_001299 [Sporobolomyces ruberrimus]
MPSNAPGYNERPGTQDALRGQGNSAARTEIPRDQVAPAQDASQAHSDSSLSKEDRSNVAGQKENNKEREIPNYITTGKDESATTSSGPTEGKVSQPSKDNKSNLVEAGTTMAGDADAYGGLKKQDEKRRNSHL